MKSQSCNTGKPGETNGKKGEAPQGRTNTPLIIGIILIFGSIIFGALIWRSYSNEEPEETQETVNEESPAMRPGTATETTIPQADSVPA